MDFTREPIIETIITPKEGYKLVIRSSKSAGQEEYFVDAVEIVAFGHALFFRSMERAKAFLVPVSDYEVLEVREARMVLKNVGLDRSIKIGGGKEGTLRVPREEERAEMITAEEGVEQEEAQSVVEAPAAPPLEIRMDKKRDRRRHYRKRRGREEGEGVKEAVEPTVPPLEDGKINIPPPEENVEALPEGAPIASTLLSSLLQPPPQLISETISRYRQNELFKGAFYLTEEEQYKPHDKVQELLNEEDEEEMPPHLKEPAFESAEQPLEEAILPEPAKAKEFVEEPKAVEETEEKPEEQLLFEEDEERPQTTLPIYAEEEDTSMMTESPYAPEQEEEEPEKDSHHTLHEENESNSKA